MESIDKYEKEHGEIIQYLKLNTKSKYSNQIRDYESAFQYWKDSSTDKFSDRNGKRNAMLEKFDLLKQYYHNCKRRKVMERLRKTEYEKLHKKYNNDFVLLKNWSNKGPDVTLLTRMQNTFSNYQHADHINRTAMLPTIQQLGARIQQRVQQYRQQQYQILYNTYKPAIDEMKTFNTEKGNKYISKIEKQLMRWSDMNIKSRNKQLTEIDKTHVAIKQEILKAKSTATKGSEVKEEDEDDNDDDDDDNDNDTHDNKSKDKQKDNSNSTNQNNSNQSQSNNTTNHDNQDNTGNSTTGTQHSGTQFAFNTLITPVNALSSPQSPIVDHPTPPMRSPASPIGSVTYSSGASSTGTDHFSCVIQTPGASNVASDQVQCEVTRKPIEMGKNDHNFHHQ